MKKVALVTGMLLVIIGLVGYGTSSPILTEQPEEETIAKAKSWTALIPAFIGLPILLCGAWVIVQPSANKIAMHVAATFGLVGALASTLRLVGSLLSFVRADGEFNQRAFTFLSLTGVLCWMLVVFCVLSFFKARQAREKTAA